MPVEVLFHGDVSSPLHKAIGAGVEDLDSRLRSGERWFVQVDPGQEQVTVGLQIPKVDSPTWQVLPPDTTRSTGEAFHCYRSVYRESGSDEPDEAVPSLILVSIQKLLAQRDHGPWISWTDSAGAARRPPRDSHEWVTIIKSLSQSLAVRLLWNERDAWRVVRAEDPPPATSASSAAVRPVDRREELREALRAAGKAVE